MSTVPEYAAAVRAALADVPPAERAELLEDLEEHLAEVAAEHEGPLEARLGAPESYAAELRAAYTDAAPSRRRRGPAELLGAAEKRARRAAETVLPENPAVRGVLADLRPVWWVARGYFAAFLINAVIGADRAFLPDGPLTTLVMLAVIAGSVWLGSRARRGAPRRPAAVLAVAGLTALGLMGGVAFAATAEDRYAYDDYGPVGYVGPAFDGVANIYAYTRDGEPLEDVLLYDQNGEPIITEPTGFGYAQRDFDPLGVPNAYPKDVCAEDPSMSTPLIPVCQFPADPAFPRVAPVPTAPAFPTGSASPTGSPTASPTAPPTQSPSASPTGTPSPTPSE